MASGTRGTQGLPPSQPTRVTAKRAHRKSKTGCVNCKARRVKCDEVKPLCGPCGRHYTGLDACEYEDVSSTPSEQSSRRRSQGTKASTPASYQSTTPPSAAPLHPFDALPNPPQSYSQDDLLPYYHSHLVFKCFPFFSSTTLVEAWWDVLSQDTLLTRIAMATTALQLERKLGRKELYQSTALTFDCVRLLQERLDDAAQAVSDETLVAVSQLIALENDTGNVKTVRLHRQALHNMVNLRGGLDLVGRSSNLAASLIFWTTMIASSEPSRLPFRFQTNGHAPPWSRRSHATQPDLTRYGIDYALAELLADVGILYTELRNVSAIADPGTGFAMVLELCRILQALITFESRNPSNYAMTEAARQASALYLFNAAQDYYPVPTLFAAALAHGLKTSITQALDYLQPDDDRSLLAWTAFIGCVASDHLPEHRWFVDHLAFLLDDMNIRSAEQLEGLADAVGFSKLSDFAAAEVWKEAEVHLSDV